MIAVPPIKSIAIIGAGDGGCAAAAQLAQRGFDILLYGRSRATTEPLSATGGIEYEGVLGEGFAPLSLITNNAGAAIAGADLVLIMVPTHAHEDVARTIAPHIAPRQVVMAAPGHTLLLIPNTIRKAGGRLGIYCDSSSLPFICRKSAPGRINITRAAQILYFAVFPGEKVAVVAEDVLEIVRLNAAQMLSVYYTKPGGLAHAKRLLAVAGAASLPCDINGSAEMGIGVAADLHLAVSSPEIVLPGTIPVTSTAEKVVTKVAGHKYLDDLIKTPFRYEKGVLYPPDGPGLGIEVDEAKIAKYRIG